jgi:flagellar assembly protein FliH
LSELARLLSREPASVRAWEMGALEARARHPLAVAPEPLPDIPAPEFLLERACDEAQSIRERAVADAEAIRTQARLDGEALGYAAGLARVQAENAAQADALRALAETLPDAWQQFCAHQTTTLTEAAILAAARLLHAQLTLEPGRIAQIVQAALAHVTDSQPAVVSVHPDDHALLEGHPTIDGRTVTFEADPRIARGGCRVESRLGIVDATREGCLERLFDALRDE